MIVAFCGHRAVHDNYEVLKWLDQVVASLIRQGADEFWFGNKGAFDQLANISVSALKFERFPRIKRTLVKAYLQQPCDARSFDDSMYPPLENVPPRYAIVRRNRYMALQADVLVTYALYHQGNAMAIKELAERKGKRVINYPALP